jgi:hypothetical protein
LFAYAAISARRAGPYGIGFQTMCGFGGAARASAARARAITARPPRLREEDLASEARQEREQDIGVPLLVEEIGTEHDVPRRSAEQRAGLVPAHALDAKLDAIARGVVAQECDRVVGPVGCESRRSPDCSRERGQSEAGAELEHAPAVELHLLDNACEREPARPQLGPVGQELVLGERLLVDELVGARRPQDGQLPAGELEAFLDQSAAKRSTGAPSGSASCA